jgi:hypothetical protein
VNAKLLERQVALAGVALLAVLGSLALGRADPGEAPSASEAVPPAPPAVGRWYEAPVGAYGPGFYGRTTSCGVQLTPRTRGVAHPILPCGARLVVAFGGRTVETAVVDRGPYGPGREFALTQALAEELGLSGVRIVRWRFPERER